MFQNQRTKDNALAAADVHCVENTGTAQQSFKAADNAIRDIDIWTIQPMQMLNLTVDEPVAYSKVERMMWDDDAAGFPTCYPEKNNMLDDPYHPCLYVT